MVSGCSPWTFPATVCPTRSPSARAGARHARRRIEDILDALGLDQVPVIGHSLGGMFALWHVAAGSGRICEVVAIGEPAVALPGVRVRMPLSLLTVRGLGIAVLRSPSRVVSIAACSPRGLAPPT